MNQFKSTTKIVKATCSDTTRPNLGCVLVAPVENSNKVILAATNGHVLAVIEETGLIEEKTLVPGSVFSKTKKEDSIRIEDNAVHNDTTGKFQPMDESLEAKYYPDVSRVIPADDISDYRCIALDAKALLAVAEAVSSKDSTSGKITLLLPPETEHNGEKSTSKAMLVMSNHQVNGELFGLIMPLSLEGGKQSDIRHRARNNMDYAIKALKKDSDSK